MERTHLFSHFYWHTGATRDFQFSIIALTQLALARPLYDVVGDRYISRSVEKNLHSFPVERRRITVFAVANLYLSALSRVKITKDELFDIFIFEFILFFFRNYLNTEKNLIIFQISELWKILEFSELETFWIFQIGVFWISQIGKLTITNFQNFTTWKINSFQNFTTDN